MKAIITEQQDYLIKCLLEKEINFKRHLFLEFYNRVPFFKENYLNEIHGYIKDEYIIDNIIEDIRKKGFPYLLFDNNIFTKKPFFDKINLYINATENDLISDIDGINCKGGYMPNKSGIFQGQYVITINIGLMYSFNVEFENILKRIKYVLSHELLHAYDDYKERLNGQTIEKKAWNNGYYRNQFVRRDNLFKRFNYLINNIERNAFIGQLNTELKEYQLDMEDGESVWQYLKKAKSYKKYLYLENFVEQLNLISSEEEKKQYIKDYNISNDTDIKTFEKLLKVINSKWNKYKRKYINTACKIAYDIFIENKLTIK